MDLYRSKEWIAFRNEVIRLDGACCARCGSTLAAGVILQVHHKVYLPGRKPWEYPYDLCESLCKGCHAQEHGKIPPRSGWTLIGYDDLGDLNGNCDRCGTPIRHVFMIDHSRWTTMEVGEFCCDDLTETNAATEFMQQQRRFLTRRKRFASSCRWKFDRSGNICVRENGINIAVVPLGANFKLRMNGTLGRLSFTSELDAKMKAFEVIESGAAKRFFQKCVSM